MKVAVIGNGKTGSKVLESLTEEQIVGPFNSSNPVTAEKLKEADIGIVFISPIVFEEIKETLIDSKIPLVIGTTGVSWNNDLEEELKKRGTTWIYGANFSLGMQIAKKLLKKANNLLQAFPEFQTQIHEVHHTQKVDAPSGTAKMWGDLIDQETQITYERRGDVKGFHCLNLSTEFETIKISHEAHDRKIFAEGAIWCAKQAYKNPLAAGLYNFNEIVEQYLQESEKENENKTQNEIVDRHNNPNEQRWRDQFSEL